MATISKRPLPYSESRIRHTVIYTATNVARFERLWR